MWTIIIAGASFVAAVILSLGRVSERGNEMAASHREELLSRTNEEDANNSEEK